MAPLTAPLGILEAIAPPNSRRHALTMPHGHNGKKQHMSSKDRPADRVSERMSSERLSVWRGIELKSDGAHIHPAQASQRFPNAIRTTRFTVLSWLPKSLYLQFHRAANIYFVMIAVISCIPWVDAKWQPKVLTVALILLAQALKDLYEDLKRWRDDKEINTRLTKRFSQKREGLEKTMWRDIDAGNLLVILKGEPFPADMLVLATADSGAFYVATKSMDGETNLKERVAPAATQACAEEGLRPEQVAKKLLKLGVKVSLEKPHAAINDLTCSFKCNREFLGLSADNFGLRGCDLQNTSWVVGVACYVGDDTKIRLNSFPPPSKTSELERFLNNCVLCILGFLVSVSLYFALASRATSDVPVYKIFAKYLVILYPVLPMTLYIAFEVLHLVIGMQIESDKFMFHEDSDTHAKTRNTSVVEELGQVGYVFSDKTGTLTANEMRFAYCSVGNVTYGPFLPEGDEPGPGMQQVATAMQGDTQQAAEARAFFEVLAVCHTVKLDADGTFQGESPDEVALVEAAADNGFAFTARDASGGNVIHKVRGPPAPGGDRASGAQKDYDIRHFLAFNSDRKRMSVICAEPDGGATVMTKGADSVMEKLLAEPLPRQARVALADFSRQGLRTLVAARRRMPPADYAAWRAKWDEAGRDMEDRAAKLDSVAALAEVGLAYAGVTALEDRLQDHVPTTIATLREAGIRVWVLTGDKVETAVEIAKSCRLIDDDMRLVKVVDTDSTADCLRILNAEPRTAQKGVSAHKGMILDGQSIGHILSDSNATTALYNAASTSSSCVCCRLSPMQKRELVEMVRAQNRKAITLAIGDGANDVPMIQGAHVGIGVRGKEGSSAVLASDLAISQFSFLGNLILCHGRNAYRRIATFLLFFIYKSLALGWSYIIYAHSMWFSGEGAYPQWLDIVWNPLTSCAVVLMLASDCDVPDEEALQLPRLYAPGPTRLLFNARVFGKWMLVATIHGVISWCVPVYGLTSQEERMDRPLKEGGPFWQASFTAFTTIFLVVHLKLLLVSECPLHLVGVAAIALELLAYVPVAIGLGSSLAPSHELIGAPQAVFTSWQHLAVLVLVPLAALAPEAIALAGARLWSDHVQPCDRGFARVDGDSGGDSPSDSSDTDTE